MSKYAMFIDCNSIAFILIGAAGQAPGECGARRGTEGRANNGRS